mmetsp:Transcript_33897/g.87951  ORF Transcript_33897/g.87951 Transcript_33897/m.87951 type:complete len:486 (-) Transcript_33897:553-2010(-)
MQLRLLLPVLQRGEVSRVARPLEAALGALLRVDRTVRVLQVHRAAEHLGGHAPRDVAGGLRQTLERLHVDDLHILEVPLDVALARPQRDHHRFDAAHAGALDVKLVHRPPVEVDDVLLRLQRLTDCAHRAHDVYGDVGVERGEARLLGVAGGDHHLVVYHAAGGPLPLRQNLLGALRSGGGGQGAVRGEAGLLARAQVDHFHAPADPVGGLGGLHRQPHFVDFSDVAVLEKSGIQLSAVEARRAAFGHHLAGLAQVPVEHKGDVAAGAGVLGVGGVEEHFVSALEGRVLHDCRANGHHSQQLAAPFFLAAVGARRLQPVSARENVHLVELDVDDLQLFGLPGARLFAVDAEHRRLELAQRDGGAVKLRHCAAVEGAVSAVEADHAALAFRPGELQVDAVLRRGALLRAGVRHNLQHLALGLRDVVRFEVYRLGLPEAIEPPVSSAEHVRLGVTRGAVHHFQKHVLQEPSIARLLRKQHDLLHSPD